MSKFICVPYIDQTEKWPTGCESVSSVMLLRYLGIEISVEEFVKYLPTFPFIESEAEEDPAASASASARPLETAASASSGARPLETAAETVSGTRMIGADPAQYFIGSPDDPDSYGCYAPVISSVLNEIFRQKNLPWKAKNVSALSTDTLLETYIDHDMPVIYWATIDLLPSRVGPEWHLYSPDGALFTWRSNEHCMLLTGHTEDKLQFNDPWHNHGTLLYDKELVIRRHKEMYSMAVVVESF